MIRIGLIAAIGLLAACSTPKEPNQDSMLTWGSTGGSSGAHLTVHRPERYDDEQPLALNDQYLAYPDPTARYVMVRVVVDNSTGTGPVAVSVSGRADDHEAPTVHPDNNLVPVLPGETVTRHFKVQVPRDAHRLTVEVYAIASQAPTTNRLYYQGDMP